MEQNSISRLLRRVRTLQILSFGIQSALVISALFVSWKIAGMIADQYAWQSPILPFIVLFAILLMVLSYSIAGFSRSDERFNAKQIDRIYDLKERITTYVEFRNNPHPFVQPLLQEASSKIGIVSAWKVSRFFSGMLLPATFLLFLVFILGVIPYLPVPQEVQIKKQERKAISAKAKELEQALHKLEMKQPSGDMKKLLQEFQKAAQKLQQPDVDKAKALKQLNAMQEKLRKLEERQKQKLASDLQNALNQAKQGEGKSDSLSDAQKAELDQLAKSFDQAMEGKNPSGGQEKQNLKSEQFSAKDLQNLKEALKKFQDQKGASDKMRSELQNTLEDAQKGMSSSSQKGSYTKNSKLKDRDIEKGKGGVEDGPGTTDKDTGPSHFDTKKQGTGKYMEDRTKSEYERLYEGQRENVGKDPLYLQNQWNENGDPSYTHVRNFGVNQDPSLTGNGTVLTGQNDQETPIRKERVPPSYQEIVKKYFENSDRPPGN